MNIKDLPLTRNLLMCQHVKIYLNHLKPIFSVFYIIKYSVISVILHSLRRGALTGYKLGAVQPRQELETVQFQSDSI